jgi:ADP-ribose pyrophosphatase YjhB (NUDIX family)
MRKNNWTDDRDPGDEDRSEHGKMLFWATPGDRVEVETPSQAAARRARGKR